MEFAQSVGHIGKDMVIMGMHLHHKHANLKPKSRKLREFWDRIHDLVQEHNVDVIMGDFNMSLFRVIPEFRSRGGVDIDLAAWYPWKSLKGEVMVDS